MNAGRFRARLRLHASNGLIPILPTKAWRLLSVLVIFAGTITSGAYLSGHQIDSRFVAVDVPKMIGDAPASTTVNRTTPATGSLTQPVSGPAATGTYGIPAVALTAYQHGAQVINSVAKDCHLDWTLIAAIGSIESDHGRTGGNTLTAKGVSTPGIYGPVLNGKGVAKISDTDGGKLDHDASFDRAVGPMQFIPSTWKHVSVDGDSDGKKDPQNINDAALGTAVYLCAGNADLSNAKGLRNAVLRYNHDQSYADRVLALAASYGSADSVMAADRQTYSLGGSGYLSRPASSQGSTSPTDTKADKPGTTKPGTSTKPSTPAKPAAPKPAAPAPTQAPAKLVEAAVTPLQKAMATCQSSLTTAQINALGGLTACTNAYLAGGMGAVQRLLGGLTGTLSTLLGG